MKAMILAAGEGRRMRPLTLSTPKPLLKIGPKVLIEYQIEKIRHAGISEIVINVSYLGEQIEHFLGDGSRLGVRIDYSKESEPLETAGALNRALPLLGSDPFLLVNGDVWHDFPLAKLLEGSLPENSFGRLILVDNPAHNSLGDFSLDDDKVIAREGENIGYTFSGISVLRPQLIADYPNLREKFPLKEVFDWAIERGQLHGEYYSGVWMDIGTPERLQELRNQCL
ncbi:N-acetylmuramate alpha-1-phosphate uridylyltransferase MurU [Teredinibacter sp. KSP-S5-2]|uniref:N-acetylmuramate alpha-1-phosphate uridylyltransferase MurU n=1 Tax=Teredinibacter sp. KSP-S5-2 TaxID=3034506 RepID=UPI002934D703|nr:nucleotidyltransferase family protein [Teredinibacter sp. KSP-S5-2]WNO08593.1 nucleotidyltransferase family protein [Teredinibacter sp. KSP-S5-2]